MTSRWFMLLLGVASVVASPALAQPSADYTYTIVGPVQPYPYYAGAPAQIVINDRGEVAYQTPLGIYRSNGASIVFIGAGQLGGINNSGEVAFIAGDVTVGQGEVIKSDGTTSTTIASGLWRGWGAYVDIDDSGGVAFTGTLNGVQGVFRGSGGAITTLVQQGDLDSDGIPLARLSQVSMANNGYVVFKATHADDVGLSGLFLTDGAAPPVKLIDDDFNPSLPGRDQYAGFDRPTISRAGSVFTWAESYDGIDGVLAIPSGHSPAWHFYEPSGALGVLVGLSGNDCLRSVFEIGQPNLLAVHDGDPNGQGDPTMYERIVGEGDTLFSYTVSTIDLGEGNQRRINNHGDFAFQATLDSGVGLLDAIVRADRVLQVVTIEASDPNASEVGLDPGEFTFRRTGDTAGPLAVPFEIAAGAGQASNGVDYVNGQTGLPLGTSVVIPAGQAELALSIEPIADSAIEGTETIDLTIKDDCAYRRGAATTATVSIADMPADSDGDGVPDAGDCAPLDRGAFAVPVEVSNLTLAADGVTLSWDSLAPVAGGATVYEVVRGSISGLPVGSQLSEVCAASGLTATTWVDPTPPPVGDPHWYLVRGRNVCGTGTYGATSNGAQQVSHACF